MVSRLTERAAERLKRNAKKYGISVLSPGFLCHGDIIVFMIAEPDLVAFMYVTPYGYIANMVMEDVDDEVTLYVRNIRSFFSHVRRYLNGDKTAL